MNKTTSFSLGILTGLGLLVIPVMLSDRLAANVSQSIYDCGIRIASGATGGSISGFNVSGHKITVCVDGAENVALENITPSE